MADLRKLTILHSNDMHGDFLAEEIDDNLVGGVSRLSGYLNKVRAEDPEALYVIAGRASEAACIREARRRAGF